jgi:alkanesulfonate monooxygenase SsuD/methylene tetrahydromethanopterin reductase-like flavin-dependent oxidoreductase (luciferase family)
MRLVLSIPSFGPFFGPGRLHEVIELARGAEAAGVDTVIVPDHVVMSENTDAYAWGPFPFPIDVPWLEPMTVLAAIAGATSRLRLATGILIAPLPGSDLRRNGDGGDDDDRSGHNRNLYT